MMQSIKKSAVVSVWMMLSAPLCAVPILDQSQMHSNGGIAFRGDALVAQTFMPGFLGILNSIQLDLAVSRDEKAGGQDMFFQVTEWTGTGPGAILGRVHVPVVASVDNRIDFSGLEIALLADTAYAIVMSNTQTHNPLPDPHFNTGASVQTDTDPYARGGLYNRELDGYWIAWPHGNASTDLAFQTYMTAPVPEPATLPLIVTLLLLTGFYRKYRVR